MDYIKNYICSDLEGKINSLCLIINSTFNRENCARDIWSLWTTDTIDTKEL